MLAVVLVAAGVVLVTVAAEVRVRRSARRVVVALAADRDGLAAQLAAERALDAARADADRARAGLLQHDLIEAQRAIEQLRQIRSEQGPAGSGWVAALWELELMRQDRVWRTFAPLEEPPVPAPAPSSGLWTLLEMELDELRDVVGTPSTLSGGPPDPDRLAALATLRLAQEVMHAVGKRADDLRLDVSGDNGRIRLTFTFSGCDPEPDPLHRLPKVAEVAARLDGDMQVDETDGRLVAHLVLPSFSVLGAPAEH